MEVNYSEDGHGGYLARTNKGVLIGYVKPFRYNKTKVIEWEFKEAFEGNGYATGRTRDEAVMLTL